MGFHGGLFSASDDKVDSKVERVLISFTAVTEQQEPLGSKQNRMWSWKWAFFVTGAFQSQKKSCWVGVVRGDVSLFRAIHPNSQSEYSFVAVGLLSSPLGMCISKFWVVVLPEEKTLYKYAHCHGVHAFWHFEKIMDCVVNLPLLQAGTWNMAQKLFILCKPHLTFKKPVLVLGGSLEGAYRLELVLRQGDI